MLIIMAGSSQNGKLCHKNYNITLFQLENTLYYINVTADKIIRKTADLIVQTAVTDIIHKEDKLYISFLEHFNGKLTGR